MIVKVIKHLVDAFDAREIVELDDALSLAAMSALAIGRVQADAYVDEQRVALYRALNNAIAEAESANRLMPFAIERDRFLKGSKAAKSGSIRLTTELDISNALRQLSPNEFERLAGPVLRQLNAHQVAATPQSRDNGVDWYAKFRVPIVGLNQVELLVCVDCKRQPYSVTSLRAFPSAVGQEINRRLSGQKSKIPESIVVRGLEPHLLVVMTSEPVTTGVRRAAGELGILVLEPSHVARLVFTLIDRRLPPLVALRQVLPVAEAS